MSRGRESTFNEIISMMDKSQSLVIVETGTIRYDVPPPYPDGHSARIFASFVKEHGGRFYSIDIDREAVKVCRKIMERDYSSALDQIEIVESDSVAFLEKFGEPIDVLYLDSANDAHLILSEAKAAMKNLHDNSIILIDDVVAMNPDMKLYKGELVIPYLEENGWVNHLTEYQAIYVKNDSRWV